MVCKPRSYEKQQKLKSPLKGSLWFLYASFDACIGMGKDQARNTDAKVLIKKICHFTMGNNREISYLRLFVNFNIYSAPRFYPLLHT